MTQKWNLQDIQPANRQRRSAKRIERQRNIENPPETTDIPIHQESSRRETSAQPAQDMHIRREASVNRISRPSQRSTATPSEAEEHFETVSITDGNKTRRKGMLIAVSVFVFIVVSGVAASIFMSGAEVTVKPRHEEKSIMATYEASTIPSPDTLSYELLTFEVDGERQVEATGKETVSEQAAGNIMIYNTFSTDNVRLVKNTRFESPNGLIFKISESAIVPGYTKDDAGKIVPGVTTASVFAEAAGEEYNISPGRFSIPGFAGSPEFEKIYAESTMQFTGGFAGEKFIIADAELETARQALHAELRDALLARLDQERPAGFVLYDDAVTVTFNTLPSVAYGDNLATIKEQGVLQVPIFKEATFAEFLAEQSIPDFQSHPVHLADYHSLNFTYTSPTTTVSDISTATKLSFNLSGNAQIIWTYDENKLKADLLGIDKQDISSVLAKYPAIASAEAVIRPFWKSSFPREMDEISVTEVVE